MKDVQCSSITKIMEKRKLTQRRLAILLSVSNQTINNWYRGRQIVPQNIKDFISILCNEDKIYSNLLSVREVKSIKTV